MSTFDAGTAPLPQPIPQPPEDWSKDEPWRDDSLADFETESDPLDAQLAEQEKRNRLAFRKHFARLAIVSMYIIWIVLILGALSWLWNYLTPWKFLSDSQLDKVQSIVFSGMMGAFASAWARRHIES
jgi:hypothetical protein